MRWQVFSGIFAKLTDEKEQELARMSMTDLNQNISASTLDTLMQDTWLLALTVRNGQSIKIDDALYKRCFSMIQHVQDKLKAAGVPVSFCEEIKFAHSVFLDELIMTIPERDISAWWKLTPLQGHFLGHLNGGEHFYDRIKKLLRDPTSASAIVTRYYRMLRFGYIGKYLIEMNEERQLLMKQLKEKLPENTVLSDAPIFIQRSRNETSLIQRSPWLICCVLLVGIVITTFIMNGHLQYLTSKG